MVKKTLLEPSRGLPGALPFYVRAPPVQDEGGIPNQRICLRVNPYDRDRFQVLSNTFLSSGEISPKFRHFLPKVGHETF